MNLNIFSPKKAVEEAFEQPNIGSAAFLVLLAAVGSALGYMLIGLETNPANTFINALISAAVRLVLLAGILMLFAKIMRKKTEETTELLSALSLTYLANFAGTIIIALALVASISPAALKTIISGAQGNVHPLQLMNSINSLPFISITGLLLILAISIVFFAVNFLLLFYATKKYLKLSSIGTIAAMLAAFAVMAVIVSLLDLFF